MNKQKKKLSNVMYIIRVLNTWRMCKLTLEIKAPTLLAKTLNSYRDNYYELIFEKDKSE